MNMAEATGVQIEYVDGSVETVEQGRRIQHDGYGDVQVLNADAQVIVTRKREKIDSVDVLYGG